jgi:hypothetical protein
MFVSIVGLVLRPDRWFVAVESFVGFVVAWSVGLYLLLRKRPSVK